MPPFSPSPSSLPPLSSSSPPAVSSSVRAVWSEWVRERERERGGRREGG